MVGGAAADNSATDDYNLGTVLHGYDSSVWCYVFRVTRCVLRVSGYELRVTGYRLRVDSYSILDPGYGHRYERFIPSSVFILFKISVERNDSSKSQSWNETGAASPPSLWRQ